MIIENTWVVLSMLGYLMLYLASGTIWSMFKWHRLTLTDKRNYIYEKRKLLSELNKSSFNQLTYTELTTTWAALESEYNEQPRKVSSNKEEITFWIVLWPLSALITFLDLCYQKCLKKILTKIYNSLVTIYTNIGLKNSKEFLDDMEKLKPKLELFDLNY